MNESEYREMQQAEVAEELALRIALERIALEEDSLGHDEFKLPWFMSTLICVILFYFCDDLGTFMWVIAISAGFDILSSLTAVRWKTVAIAKLESLRVDTRHID